MKKFYIRLDPGWTPDHGSSDSTGAITGSTEPGSPRLSHVQQHPGTAKGVRLMKRIRAGAIAVLAAAGLALAPSAPATAGTLCNTTGLCGVVTNLSSSNRSLLVATSWPTFGAPTTIRLYPGQTSKGRTKDADGYFVPYGCSAYTIGWGNVSAGWHKIVDGQHALVKLTCP